LVAKSVAIYHVCPFAPARHYYLYSSIKNTLNYLVKDFAPFVKNQVSKTKNHLFCVESESPNNGAPEMVKEKDLWSWGPNP
jgi:hypothetical protein